MGKLETIKHSLLPQKEECGFSKEVEWIKKKEFLMETKWQL